LGIPEDVLEVARHHQDGGGQEIGRSLEALERLKSETEKERLQLLKTKEETELQRQRLKTLLEEMKRRKQEIFLQAEEKANRAIQKLEEELKEWVRRQKEERAHLGISPLKTHRKEIQEIKEKILLPTRRRGSSAMPVGLKVGDRVRIVSLRSHGILVSVEEPLKQVEVMTEKARVRTSLTDVVRVMEGEEEVEILRDRPLPKEIVQEPPSQLNVIGLTVEDAIPKVDKFVDQAILHGLDKIHIIHGVGSGRLGSAIGKYLEGHRGVKGFGPGDLMKGGRGITVVELR